MTWNLRTSQNDRIAYEQMAHGAGIDSARVLNDEDLEHSDARQVAWEVFEADISAGQVDVDDIEEARSIWIYAFSLGYKEEQADRRMPKDEEVA